MVTVPKVLEISSLAQSQGELDPQSLSVILNSAQATIAEHCVSCPDSLGTEGLQLHLTLMKDTFVLCG